LALFAKELVLGAEKEQSQRERNDVFVPNDEIDKCLKRLIEIDLKKKLIDIEAQMRNAEIKKDNGKVAELSNQFNILSQKLDKNYDII